MYQERKKSMQLDSYDQYVLIYDSACGICVKFRRFVDFLDPREKLEFSSLLDADAGGLLSSMPIALRHKSFHFRLPNGKILSGAEAVPELMRQLPSGSLLNWFVTGAPIGMTVIRFLYGNISRFHDSDSCRYTKTVEVFSPAKRNRIGILRVMFSIEAWLSGS